MARLGHKVSQTQQLVLASGHWVWTGGQQVSTGGHRVRTIGQTVSATWQEVDFMTLCWFFLASGVWLDILLNLGIDMIIDGIFEQFGEIGKIFSSVVYEIISRLENIPALKCD